MGEQVKDSQAMPRVVSFEEWQSAREEHLKREKELTRKQDELAAAARRVRAMSRNGRGGKAA